MPRNTATEGTRLSGTATLQQASSAAEVLQVFEYLASNTDNEPSTGDSEASKVQFLRLFFVDVLNRLDLEQRKADWNKEIVLKIILRNSHIPDFNAAINQIAIAHPRWIEARARAAEAWVRTRMTEYLHRKKDTDLDNNVLPAGAITFRILRVCAKLRNTMVSSVLLLSW